MDATVLVYALIGFAAQLIDGSIGMAYGLISTSSLIAAGVAPASATAAVHLSEVFTTGASGLSHWRLGNVDRGLLRRLALPGVIGGAIGAAIVSVVPDNIVKPAVAAYLVIMGAIVLLKAFDRAPRAADHRHIGLLGFVGALIDAFGGGWGPVVASTLIAKGHDPRQTIGSVNLAEFFVTVAQSAMFFSLLGLVHLEIVVALVVGGVIAAPLAAQLTRRLPLRLLIFVVGATVACLSGRSLYFALSP
ncbi:MAG: sulfite exporter TauE/SafE family protein [Proteobacteria bacterium]|nr:sulfite exporter TauE/SafE family protein [Pseudomonadota bacterium]